HHPRQATRKPGRGLIAELVGEPRVAGQIQEADRRRSLHALVAARLHERDLEAVEVVAYPPAALVTVEDRKEGSVSLVRESVRPFGRGRTGFGHFEADLDKWDDHFRPPP